MGLPTGLSASPHVQHAQPSRSAVARALHGRSVATHRKRRWERAADRSPSAVAPPKGLAARHRRKRRRLAESIASATSASRRDAHGAWAPPRPARVDRQAPSRSCLPPQVPRLWASHPQLVTSVWTALLITRQKPPGERACGRRSARRACDATRSARSGPGCGSSAPVRSRRIAPGGRSALLAPRPTCNAAQRRLRRPGACDPWHGAR